MPRTAPHGRRSARASRERALDETPPPHSAAAAARRRSGGPCVRAGWAGDQVSGPGALAWGETTATAAAPPPPRPARAPPVSLPSPPQVPPPPPAQARWGHARRSLAAQQPPRLTLQEAFEAHLYARAPPPPSDGRPTSAGARATSGGLVAFEPFRDAGPSEPLPARRRVEAPPPIFEARTACADVEAEAVEAEMVEAASASPSGAFGAHGGGVELPPVPQPSSRPRDE